MRRYRTPPAAVVGSLTALAVATGLVFALRPIAPTLSLGVIYVPAVLVTAIVWGLGYAVPVAVLSMVAFNFLFLAPVGRLTLADGRNWTALAVYLAIAVVSSELATRARRRAAEAERRERETALIADAAAELLNADRLHPLLDDVRARAAALFAGEPETSRVRFDAALDALLAVAEERERLELASRDAEALRRSDAIKTTVIQAVSHDFRTPLATIEAAIGGLENGSLELSEADRASLLETIALESRRLTRLVANVLDLSRLQAGAAPPHPELWAVEELIAEALDASPGSARVQVDVPEALPPVRVDAVQMQRVLANLIENALKFSPPESEVSVRAESRAGHVVVEIADRGPGIGDDEAVLEPFARGRSSSGTQGTGLGLAIAAGFASANDSELTIAKRPGGGTIVSLSLPSAPVPTGSHA